MIATSSTTVGEMVAGHEATLAAATADRDWGAVQVEARHLQALDRLATQFGGEAVYLQTLVGHRVIR